MTTVIDKIHYSHKELALVVDFFIKEGELDGDLEKGNFNDWITVNKNSIEFLCLDPIFSEQISMRRFKETLAVGKFKKLGVEHRCKNCSYFNPISKKKDAFGICSWEDRIKPRLPFWAKIVSHGAIDPEHLDCSEFIRKNHDS